MTASGLQRIEGSALRFHLSGALERPTSLVLLLHGSGTHGGDLLPVAERLSVLVPGALFVLPDAPQSYRDVLSPDDIAATERERPGIDWEQTRTWLRPVEATSTAPSDQRYAFLGTVRTPVRAVNRLLDLLRARHELPDSAVAMYGFSQGGMMAVYVAIDRNDACAGVVCHSGQFYGADNISARPPVLLMVGALELEPSQQMSAVYPITVAALRDAGLPFEEHACAALLHGMNPEAITRIGEFLSRALHAHGASDGFAHEGLRRQAQT
ncbi:MAG: alpha/beta fold hydrolase [Gemmatimonadota bacterium]